MKRERVCLDECLLAVVSAGVVLFASAAAGADAGERANEEKQNHVQKQNRPKNYKQHSVFGQVLPKGNLLIGQFTK